MEGQLRLRFYDYYMAKSYPRKAKLRNYPRGSVGSRTRDLHGYN